MRGNIDLKRSNRKTLSAKARCSATSCHALPTRFRQVAYCEFLDAFSSKPRRVGKLGRESRSAAPFDATLRPWISPPS